jgi:hypothetical protein
MDFDIEDITDIYSKEMRSMTDEKKRMRKMVIDFL